MIPLHEHVNVSIPLQGLFFFGALFRWQDFSERSCFNPSPGIILLRGREAIVGAALVHYFVSIPLQGLFFFGEEEAEVEAAT